MIKANPHFKPLEQAMAARFGWQTNASWRDKLLAAITMKAEKLGLDHLAYCRMAVASATELDVLAGLVSNSETRFFREPEQFEALKNVVVPELIGSRHKERKLDLWSAACSSGEEAYSLAILLAELLPEDENWKTKLFATDLRGEAIISASKGRYTASTIGLIAPELRGRYFVRAGSNGHEKTFDVIQPLRKRISFRRANVYDPQFWKGVDQQFDLILCNNLLLYFHALAARQTVERIAGALRRGGLLMVMKNEMSYVDHPTLKLDSSLPGSFFRKV